MNIYAVSADLIVTFHLMYVCFTVGGEIIILTGAAFSWKWIRNRTFRIIHLVSVIAVAVEAVIGAVCPLTEWEHNLRDMAGQHTERDITFVGRLIRLIIFYDFPAWIFTLLYIGFGIIVLATFIFIKPYSDKR